MMNSSNYTLLNQIDEPADLRRLTLNQLPVLCDELRQFVIETVSITGGHLASSLGVIELTVAIHYVFDTPNDSLVWDVGHQAYPHKILTKRRNKMSTLRQKDGLSGFPKRCESIYDDFGVGHSSTSISAALGMAIANQILGKDQQHIAVIGDGAMTAGMAFEALHHSASLSANLLVILNDNEMSISPNVGGFSSYLSKILTSDFYFDVRSKGKQVLQHFPPFGDLAKIAENKVKEIAGSHNLFEDFGFSYTGPENGHDVLELVKLLTILKSQKGPRLLHIKTVKGKGYAKAESQPIDYHGVGKFNPVVGLTTKLDSKPTFTDVFSAWICQQASQSEKLVGITPAMREGSGLVKFSQLYKNRYFDVAIAEQHALTLAAGMACKGLKPVVAIYSTFLQRAYDQLVHDIALQNLDVLFAVDRAGVVGEDGATHAGIFDIAFCKPIPNLVIMTPSDESEMFKMLNTGYDFNGPALVRYPKGIGSIGEITICDDILPIGKALSVRSGKKLAILVFGTLLANCRELADKYDATLINMRFVKPLDIQLITELAHTHTHFISIEEGTIIGGIGETVQTIIYNENKLAKIKLLGLSDTFPAQGKRDEVLADYQLDSKTIKTEIIKLIN